MSAIAFELEPDTTQLEPRQTAPPVHGWRTRRRVACAALVIWTLSGFFLVASDQQAVVTVFGKVVDPRVMPGLHYTLPWPVAVVSRLKVRQQQRLAVGGDLPDSVIGRSQPLKSQFLTGDQNIINLRVVVQYSVSTPIDYLFRSAVPAQLAAAAVEAELARRVAHSSVDAVLTTEKGAIQDEVRTRAQSILDGYRCGVRLSTVNIESAVPPPEAANAFRDVAGARADTARIVSNAEGYANDLVPKARGQARQLLEEAGAYRQKRMDEAAGDVARFNQIFAEYAKAPEVTRRRLYLETMEQVLPRIRKLIVDKNQNVDLTIVRKGSSQ